MSKELEAIFDICDSMFQNAQIDFECLIKSEMNEKFFEDYNNVRIVNSFLFNFSKLQDKIGAKLFKKFLYELKEIDKENMPMLDILNLLEKLQIIDDSKKWDELREIRNSLSHDYPNNIAERIENIELALKGYTILKEIYDNLKKRKQALLFS